MVTLPNNGAWSYTWQNLPDGYQYYVTEEWVHAGSDQTDIKGNFVVYYDGNKGGDASSAVNGSTIVITNLLKGPGRRPTKVTAEKDWKQGEEQASPGADSVTLQLYQVKNTPAAFDSLATIENPSNGTLTILNGRDFDDPTLFLRFTVKTNEDKRDGWGAGALSNARYEPYTDLFINASTQDSTVYRYFALQDLKDVKDGLKLNFWAEYAELLAVEVVRATSSTTAEAVAVEPAVELNSENKWRAEWTGLPTVVESTGEYYTYYVVETAVDGYTTTYQVGDQTYITASDAAVDPYGTIIVTNTKQPETTSITVNKVWLDSSNQGIDGNSESLPASITFYLTRTANGTTERVDSSGNTGDTAQPYTLTKENSWTMTIENLPLKDSYGNTYSYSATEVSVEGYTSAVTSDGTTITITNTQTTTPSGTSLTVKKEWKNADGSDLTVDKGYSVIVQLGRAKASSNVLATSDVKDGRLTILDGVDMTNQNLVLRLTYRKEASTEDKTGWGYAGFRRNPVADWKVDPDLTLRLPSNEPGEYAATVPLTQLATIMGSEGIHFQIWENHAKFISMELINTSLPEVGGEVTVDESYTPEIVTLNESNNWQHTWYNLDSTSEDGSIYTYYVKEVRVENAEHTDITDKFTVTNNYGDKDHAVGVSGEITITNTLKSTYVLPETGGAGIGFYRIGGSLLMGVAAAGLIGNTKRKKRKEADKTS